MPEILAGSGNWFLFCVGFLKGTQTKHGTKFVTQNECENVKRKIFF